MPNKVQVIVDGEVVFDNQVVILNSPDIDPATGINYGQFRDDNNLTEQQALDKLKAAGVLGGFGLAGPVGWNPPYVGWKWEKYRAVNGKQTFPQGHPVQGGSPG